MLRELASYNVISSGLMASDFHIPWPEDGCKVTGVCVVVTVVSMCFLLIQVKCSFYENSAILTVQAKH